MYKSDTYWSKEKLNELKHLECPIHRFKNPGSSKKYTVTR